MTKRMSPIKIMNLHKTQPSRAYDIRVCRPSILGNLFIIDRKTTRIQACTQYQDWADIMFDDTVAESRRYVRELLRLIEVYKRHRRLRLFCWCSPEKCHAETIKKYIEEHIKKNDNAKLYS